MPPNSSFASNIIWQETEETRQDETPKSLAEQYFTMAQNYQDSGVEQNLESAVYFYKLALGQGYVSAIHPLMEILMAGQGNNHDFNSVIKLIAQIRKANQSSRIQLVEQ